MDELGVDVLLLSLGADLPWLTGYRAMALERLTVLVLCKDADPVLVVPGLEAPRVPDPAGVFEVLPWAETEDPVALACRVVGRAVTGDGPTVAVSDRMWAGSLLAFWEQMPGAAWLPASRLVGPLRAVKDAGELSALRAAAAAADRVATALQGGDIPLIGRREIDVSNDIARRLLDEGHREVNFSIVGSGPNGASPHHDAGQRVIGAGEVVVCDFGGGLGLGDDVAYCSDITRTVVTGPPTSEVAEAYAALRQAQRAGVAAVRPGVSAESVDALTRAVLVDAGLGERFIHRTGHGIGIEEHEDPYLVSGNRTPLVPGHAFSVEPGVYFPGRFGMRLEDIVVVTGEGGEAINRADHGLALVDA